MSSTVATSERKYEKRYNLQGTIADLTPGRTSAGEPKCTFRIVREGKPPQYCAAFDSKATDLLAKYRNDDVVRLFGYYKREEFRNGNGQMVTSNEFRVLKSEPPWIEGAPAQAPAATDAKAPAYTDPWDSTPLGMAARSERQLSFDLA